MASSRGIKAGRAFVELDAVDKTARVFRMVERRLMRMGDKMIGLGKRMIMSSAALAAPFGLSLKLFADFDDAMRRVQTRTSSTAAEMKKLRDQAKELGRTTSFTATQVADLMGVLGQKGFNREQIGQMTPNVMNLARSAGSGDEGDAALAADLVSGQLRAFQLDASQAARLADVFSTAVNNSNFTLQGLNDAMAAAGPLAHEFGLSVEETVATLATMTNLNISASSAGKALETFFARMSNETYTTAFNERLAKLNREIVQFKDAEGNLRPMLEILADIEEATKGMGTADKGGALAELFGVFQFGKAAGASSGATKTLKELLPLLRSSEGAAAKAAKEMDDGLGGAFRKAMSAIEGVALALGDALAPTIQRVAEILAFAAEKVTGFIEKNQETVLVVAAVIAGIGAMGVALVATGIVLSSVATIFGTLATLISFILSPIGLLTVALAGVATAAYQMSDTFRSYVDGMAIAARESFSAIADTFNGVMGDVLNRIMAGDIEAAFKLMCKGMELTWAETLESMTSAWDSVRTRWWKGTQKINLALGLIDEGDIEQQNRENAARHNVATRRRREELQRLRQEYEDLRHETGADGGENDIVWGGEDADAEIARLTEEARREAALKNGGGPMVPGGQMAIPDLGLLGPSSFGPASPGVTDFMNRGSAEAFRAFHSSQADSENMKWQEQQRLLAEEQLAEQKRTNDLLENRRGGTV